MNKLFLLFFTVLIFGCGSSSDDTTTTIDEETEPVLFSPVFSIILKRCVECHSKPTQNGAPMSLISYDDIFESADSIKTRINLEESNPLSMPLDKPLLSQEERDTITEWVDAGKPNN